LAIAGGSLAALLLLAGLVARDREALVIGVIAAIATAIVVAIYFAFYYLAYLPRGVVQ